MARITDNLVIQRIGDDKLVIIDTETMNETVVPITAGGRLTAMSAYLSNPQDPAEALIDAIRQLTRTQPLLMVAQVRAEDASQVLNFFYPDRGRPAGSFRQQLMSAMGKADDENLARLIAVFPGLGAAMALAMREPGGIETLQDIADGSNS